MSRRSAGESPLSGYHRPFWRDIAGWVVRLPRLIRIIVVGLFGLAVTFALSPLVDYLYLSYMYTDNTRILPSLVSAAAGVIMYLFGWWLIIGVAGEVPPVRRAVVWYVIVGSIALILIIALSALGLSSANAPL